MGRIQPHYTLPVALILTCVCCGCANYRICDAPACKDDAAISAEARSLLQVHAALDPSSVHVETRNHVVYLYGIVDTEYEWQEAQAVVGNDKDVVRVVNLMGVNNR
jgi:osmotically-inducible protein OsmY